MAVKAVPEGYQVVTPYLVVEGAGQVLDFVKEVFGAKETVRMDAEGGKVGHAEVKIGDSIVMMADASVGEQGTPMPAVLNVYVEDVDATYKKALEAGATSLREPVDQFYGDRSSGVKDAAGNQWWIATHIEDVSEEEMRRRMQEMQGG